MKIRAVKIIDEEFADIDNLGEGSKIYGGRWNSPGTPVIYSSEHLSLANLEVLVAVRKNPLISISFLKIYFEFDSSHVEKVDVKTLSIGWNSSRHSPETIKIGDAWTRSSRKPVLKVPSSLIEGEFNFLINPEHQLFSKIIISNPEPFEIDERLIN